MHDTVKALKGLQAIDRDLYAVQRELKRLPAELQARETSLRTQQAEIDSRRVVLRDLQTRIREIEDHTTLQRQRQRKVEAEAMKSRGDVAMIAAFQHQARTLKHEIAEEEDEGLILVGQAEEQESAVVELEARLAAESATFTELRKNIAIELEDAKVREAALLERRRGCCSKDVDAVSLRLYERLLEARQGDALAELDGKVCQSCFMELRPNQLVQLAQGRTLVQCPNCDRIVVPR
ncbi:MAG TPA: C4-type zinc ribbon domain-containing protein [Planctomycetota bacterium]|jgi:predicted  nucleic acid-binding Zn-ribbon protein|nr:C4-type zinc ribbon domain-containing protein [Planctomycetota bacterium]